MPSKILNYEVFNGNMKQLIQYIEEFKKVHIVSGNPEVLYAALKDEKLMKNITSINSVIIPDGIGTVLAAKLAKQPVAEKIAGIEVMEEVIKFCYKEKRPIYLLGAEEEVLIKCRVNLILKFPSLNICGYHNGFFDLQNCNEIINEIIDKKPYAIFVAMGAPRQENFISDYMDILPCKIFMGVGGSFDNFAGKVKRAPKWMIKLGFEWLYRVTKEPWRIRRLSSIPKFLLKVLFYKEK